MKDFTAAFAELQKTLLPPGAKEAVDKVLHRGLRPELEKHSGQKVDGRCTVRRPTPDPFCRASTRCQGQGLRLASAKIMNAGDRSAWTKSNERYQPFFSDFASRFPFDDAMLIDTDGNVVYSRH